MLSKFGDAICVRLSQQFQTAPHRQIKHVDQPSGERFGRGQTLHAIQLIKSCTELAVPFGERSRVEVGFSRTCSQFPHGLDQEPASARLQETPTEFPTSLCQSFDLQLQRYNLACRHGR